MPRGPGGIGPGPAGAGNALVNWESYLLVRGTEAEMHRRFMTSGRKVRSTLAAVTMVLASVAVMGQAPGGPGSADKGSGRRTPWGHPDLQGTWTSDSVMGVPFERAKTELSPQEKTFQQ